MRRPELSAVYGTRAELLERLEDCLAFARRTVERADPAHELWAVDLGQVSGYEKMMMEAGLLAHLVGRTGLCDEAVERLAHAIRAKYDAGPALSCILRQPRLAASLGTLLLVLDSFGLATDRERAVVGDALESPYLGCSEHVPFRLLDRHWVLGLAGGTPDPLVDALRLSTACRTTHPIYMTREDGYAITHAVMYATDFGAKEVPRELSGDALWDTIDAAVAWCTAAGDHDLLAELLLVQLLLRRRLSAYGAIAWRRCRETWDAFGFLPSPSLSATSFRALDDEAEQQQYAFHNMYHTMLVGGLLCAVLLDLHKNTVTTAAERSSYDEPPSVTRAIERAVGHLECVLGVDAATARQAIAAVNWNAGDAGVDGLIEAWGGSDGTAGAATTSMAIDASIVLAAQDYDLPRLAGALRLAIRADVVTETVVAGADFLARQLPANGATAVNGDAKASAAATAALANCLLGVGEHLSRHRESLR